MNMDEKEVHQNFEVLTEISALTKREIGVCVCGDKNGFFFDDVLTIGTQQKGIITCTCNSIQKLFHTHPIGTSNPSTEDIEALNKTNLNQGEYCVGTMENGKPKIKCYNISKLKTKQVGKNFPVMGTKSLPEEARIPEIQRFIFSAWIHPKAGGDDYEEIVEVKAKTYKEAEEKLSDYLKTKSTITTDYTLIPATAEIEQLIKKKAEREEAEIKRLRSLIEAERIIESGVYKKELLEKKNTVYAYVEDYKAWAPVVWERGKERLETFTPHEAMFLEKELKRLGFKAKITRGVPETHKAEVKAGSFIYSHGKVTPEWGIYG
jgi:hypothetical protein